MLELLLSHGGDPYAKNSYNKNAFDISKPELDAANQVPPFILLLLLLLL